VGDQGHGWVPIDAGLLPPDGASGRSVTLQL
jgi:hypothetical protein